MNKIKKCKRCDKIGQYDCFMLEDHQFTKDPDCPYCNKPVWSCVKCGIETDGTIGGFYQR